MLRNLTLAAAMTAAMMSAQVKLPQYQRSVLPNGVVLDLVQKPGVPLVSFRVMVKGGAEADPNGLEGLARTTATLLRRGTAKYKAAEFSEKLDALGGEFGANSGDSASYVYAEFLRKDFDQGLELLTEAVLRPTFPEDEVKKQLAQDIDRTKSVKDNPEAAIGQYEEAFFFGASHPWGRPATEASLAKITRADIAAFHKRLYAGRNMVVIVAGDFEAAAAQSKLAAVFGSVAAGAAFEYKTAPTPPLKTRLLLVDKPDATQTYFRIDQPGIDRKNPDRVKLRILNTLFGGRFTSMLNEALRVNSGLSYGARSVIEEGRVPGWIQIQTYTKTETTVKAIDLAVEMLKNLSDKGITAEQLASAKAYMKGTYPTAAVETADQVASVIANLELYGLGREEIDGYFQKIDAVTLEEINAAAKKYFKTSGLTFVLLGNASKIRDAVRKYSDDVTEIPIAKEGFGGSEKR